MGLFNKFFNSAEDSKAENVLPFIDLKEESQLDALVELSKTKTQIIFKHSTRCGVSRMVFATLKREYSISSSQADIYYLDLIAYREISNEIAKRFDVRHESPQLLIIKNGTVVAHESHGDINDIAFEQYV